VELLPGQRQDLIRARLDTEGRVIAAELAGEIGVSEDTVRRDLRDLASRGQCVRVYGGALPIGEKPGTLAKRASKGEQEKAELARTAVKWITEGATVFLDAASTNIAIARSLPPELSVTCITNAPQIAAALALHDSVELVVIGGGVDRRLGASVGAKAVADAAELRPDICFPGACGVDAMAGITTFHADDAAFKRMIVERSAMTIIPVTSAKLGKAAPFQVMSLADCTAVIVESDAPDDIVSDCEKAGATVYRAEECAQ
jgi:DeoR/GlpR family transcriptional regulator of sugar metabolism